MAIAASFTVSQGADKTKFSIQDTTPYSGEELKESFTSRSLILYKADGTVFRQPGQTTDEIDFNFNDYPTDVIEITGLDQDYAFRILLTIVPVVTQSGSLYTATVKTALNGYTMSAFFERMHRQSLYPRMEKNDSYNADTHRILMNAEHAVKAAAADDISAAQQSLDRARRIIKIPIPY
jgi:hypothetical protein